VERNPSELHAKIDLARSRGLSIEQTERTRFGYSQWTLTVPGQFAVNGLVDHQVLERLDHPHRFEADLGQLSEAWISAVHQAGHSLAMVRYDLDSLNVIAAYGPIAHTEVTFRDFSPALIATMRPRPVGGAWADHLEQIVRDSRCEAHGDGETAGELLTDPEYYLQIRDDVQQHWVGICTVAERLLSLTPPAAHHAATLLRATGLPEQRPRTA
jgi:hypothetical protein